MSKKSSGGMRKIDYLNKVSKEQIPTPKQVYEKKQKKLMKKHEEQKAGKEALFEAKRKLMEEKGWNRVNPMGDGEDRWDVKDVVKIVHRGIAEESFPNIISHPPKISDARKRSKKTYE